MFAGSTDLGWATIQGSDPWNSTINASLIQSKYLSYIEDGSVRYLQYGLNQTTPPGTIQSFYLTYPLICYGLQAENTDNLLNEDGDYINIQY